MVKPRDVSKIHWRRHIMLSIGIAVIIGVASVWFVQTRHKATIQTRLITPTEQTALGQSVYAQHCASCHGAQLEGQPNWKQPLPTGGFPAPPHDETGHTWHHPDALLFKIIKFGGQATAGADFKSNMPAFNKVMTDEDIWAVLTYIKSHWPERQRAHQERVSRKQ